MSQLGYFLILLLVAIPLGGGPLDVLLLVTGGEEHVSIRLNQNENPGLIGGGRQNAHLLVEAWENHGYIHISGNEDFKTTAQSEGWPGDGSSPNPYLIDGLNITSVNRDALSIWYTDVHFQINNCHLAVFYDENEPFANPPRGINFSNVSNAIISNNTIVYSSWGIDLRGCSNITFINNNVRVHGDGFDIILSDNIRIVNNTISNIVHEAITLESSGNSIISGNRITYIWGTGINLQSSWNTHISNNTILDCVAFLNTEGDGIKLLDSSEIMVSENKVSQNNGSGIVISASEQTHVIKNIISKNNGTGINLTSSSVLVINNSVCNNSAGGMEMSNSIGNTLFGNNVSYNGWDGLFLEDTREIALSANTITNNGETGITLENSGDVKITDNNVTHNHDTGIMLFNCWENNITTNNISNNAINGIILWDSTNTNISTNVIAFNGEYGVYLTHQAIGNIIEWNDFIQNNINGTSQAYDEGENNTFDYNYWDDWITPDTNYDGIVDRPYPIAGPENNTDLHPRAPTPPIRWNVLFGLLLLGGIIVILGLVLVRQNMK